jgi:hypothetical protein
MTFLAKHGWMIGLLVLGTFLPLSGAPRASALSDAAAALKPGQSVRLVTTLPASVLRPDDFTFLQWGSSAVWDPVRKEFRFIGKRYSVYPYRFLVYSEATNSWSSDRALHAGLSTAQNGHGFDHNTVDPATGTNYFYANNSIYVWSGTWSILALPNTYHSVAAGLSWVDQFAQAGAAHSGLVYSDEGNLIRYDGGKWVSLGTTPVQSYHSASEYNRVGNVLLFGGGNGGNGMWKIDARTQKVTAIATPPFNLGASESQGVLVSDPSSDQLVGWDKNTGNWTQYDVSANAWSSISRVSGDGAVARDGAPNLSVDSSSSVIGAPISSYGVLMFVHALDSGSSGVVWLYKHSDSVVLPTPNPPDSVSAR